jgi:nucleotide-binding universal stress UspA family protein
MNRLAIEDPEQALNVPFIVGLQEAAGYAASLGMSIRTEHRVGIPSEEIVACADQVGAELIVLGGCHRSQLQRVMLGRTTARIIADAPCPVLIVPEGTEVQFGTIVVGGGGARGAAEAGQAVLQLAEAYGSAVHALNVVDIPADRSLRYGVMQEAEQKGRAVVDGFMHQVRQHELRGVGTVRRGAVDKVLADYAAEVGAQLIVVGAKKLGGVGRAVSGSIVERIVSRAPCPVLAVRSMAALEEA